MKKTILAGVGLLCLGLGLGRFLPATAAPVVVGGEPEGDQPSKRWDPHLVPPWFGTPIALPNARVWPGGPAGASGRRMRRPAGEYRNPAGLVVG